MYLLKLAARPWRMAPLSQIFSSLAVGFLLLLTGFLFWMDRGLQPVVKRLQSEQVITAFIDPSVDPRDDTRIVDAIRLQVGAHAEIKQVGTQQFIDEVKGRYPELGKELEDLGSEMTTVIPRYVTVFGMLGADTADAIKKVQGVESVDSSKERYRHILGAVKTIRFVAKLLAAGLCLALLTGLIHLSRMNAHLHQETVALMKLWGADELTVRFPGLLSGLGVGVLGGALASAAWLLGGAGLAHQVQEISPLLKSMPTPNLMTGVILFGAGTLMGMLSGMLGATASESRG